MLTTYHSHSIFCDGAMTPEDYVLSAIQKGFRAFGFSSHAPVSFDTYWTMKKENLQNYIETTQALKEKYKNQIQLYISLETDYYPGGWDYRTHPGLDYTIGSVHFLYHEATGRYMPLDGTAEEFAETRDIAFGKDVRKLIETYYRLMADMVRNQTPDIIGHLDVLKKNNSRNRFFDESEQWYHAAVDNVLHEIQKKNVIVEANTGGISRGYTTEVYPSGWILKKMRERDIPVVLNSDAHHPDWIDAAYEKAVQLLKAAGYTHQRVLLDGIWQDVKLTPL